MSDRPSPRVFNGRYQVERELARGGMATVYLGQDLVLDRTVALKVLSGDMSRDQGFVERFRREARAAASLNHPNIVSVYDWGEADGSYFIVMEYVPGPTLAQRLHAEEVLPAEAAAVGAEIAAALAEAHRHGVVHRDVKPGNVLIDADGRVKVADFGIARAAWANPDTRLTQTGMVLGTATYLSPEQAEGGIVDARSDVYSLGVVIYEMVTGRPPFGGDTPLSIAYQHARADPQPPRRLNPAVPEWLEGIVLRAMAKDPGRRYQSAEDLRGALLRRAPGGTSSFAPQPTEPGSPTPSLAPTRRYEPETAVTPRRWGGRPWIAAALVVVAVAAALGLYLALTGSSGPEVPRQTAPPTTPSTTTTTNAATPSTSAPTSFAGYQIVAGSGVRALYCPAGVALGDPGETGQLGNTHGGTPGSGGQGGPAGCGSNGGKGGHGGEGAPGAAGGAAGNGGNGGCAPATLIQMRAGDYPCDGTRSDGGDGGNGGNAAPTADGGSGGGGGHGGNAERAKGGDGGNGGNASPGTPGSPGAPGQPGGGPTGTEAGVNGQNGANG